jgi:fido (protein-threonine AMPylation protein)
MKGKTFACHLVIALGTMARGWKIITTMATKITKVTPFEGGNGRNRRLFGTFIQQNTSRCLFQ